MTSEIEGTRIPEEVASKFNDLAALTLLLRVRPGEQIQFMKGARIHFCREAPRLPWPLPLFSLILLVSLETALGLIHPFLGKIFPSRNLDCQGVYSRLIIKEATRCFRLHELSWSGCSHYEISLLFQLEFHP